MKSKEPFYKYAEDIINGKKIVGKYERLMVERFFKDLDKGDFTFDYEKGKRIVDFAKICNHHKGHFAGKPIIFEPFQQFTIIQKYGWLKDDGTRRFSSSYKKVARGNGKTTELAVESLFLVSKDGEHGAQVYCGATKEEQARILVNDAGKIVQASPHIRDKFSHFAHQDTIKRVVYPTLGGFIAALGRDSKRDDGFDPHGGMIDEFHAHPNNEVRNIQESGMVKRLNPLMNIITTAGFNKHGPCYKYEQMCKRILDRDIEDESVLVSIYDMDEEDLKNDNWHNPELWGKPNPNLGVSVNPEKLRTRFKTCLNEGGEQIVDFQTKNLNIWTDASSVWIPSDVWMNGKDKPIVNGQKWFLGVDLSSTSDYTAVSFISEEEDGHLNIFSWGFIPEESFKKRLQKESIYLNEWEKQGHLIKTPGNVVDYAFVEQFIKDKWIEIGGHYGAFDKWGAIQMIQRLESEGLDIAQIPQTMGYLSEPAKYLERKALNGLLRHGGNGLLAWMVGNCVAVYDSKENIWIDKEFRDNKIDMVKSILFAIRAMMEKKEEEKPDIDKWIKRMSEI